MDGWMHRFPSLQNVSIRPYVFNPSTYHPVPPSNYPSIHHSIHPSITFPFIVIDCHFIFHWTNLSYTLDIGLTTNIIIIFIFIIPSRPHPSLHPRILPVLTTNITTPTHIPYSKRTTSVFNCNPTIFYPSYPLAKGHVSLEVTLYSRPFPSDTTHGQLSGQQQWSR